MTPTTLPRPLSLGDRLHRWDYLQRVELWLEPMPGRRRRQVLRDLRSGIADAAADVGMRAALADLGSPRLLARSYLSEEPSQGPRWVAGALAAGLAVGAWMYATLFYVMGMLDALLSVGATGAATGSFLGTTVLAQASDGGLSAELTGFPWVPLVVLVVVFGLVSRVWRLVWPAR